MDDKEINKLKALVVSQQEYLNKHQKYIDLLQNILKEKNPKVIWYCETCQCLKIEDWRKFVCDDSSNDYRLMVKCCSCEKSICNNCGIECEECDIEWDSTYCPKCAKKELNNGRCQECIKYYN